MAVAANLKLTIGFTKQDLAKETIQRHFKPTIHLLHARATSIEAWLREREKERMCVCVSYLFLWPVFSVPCPSPTSPYASLSPVPSLFPLSHLTAPLCPTFPVTQLLSIQSSLQKRIAHWWDCWPIYREDKNHQSHNLLFVNTLEFTKSFHTVSLTFPKQVNQGSVIKPDEDNDI